MFFSYLKVCESNLDSTIINRGQKLFLDGKVLFKRDLVLDYWQIFDVIDTTNTYRVKLPLLHLALNRDKWHDSYQAFQETASCTCQYFAEYGLCRHFTSVCAFLDHKYKIKQAQMNNIFGESNTEVSIFDNIDKAESSRLTNYWLNEIERIILENRASEYSKFLSQLTTELNLDFNKNYSTFFQSLDKIILKYSKDFILEKNVLNLAIETLLHNSKLWWSYWEKIVFSADFQNAKSFWAKLFNWRSDANIQSILSLSIGKAKDIFNNEQKQEIFDKVFYGYNHTTSNPSTAIFSAQYEFAILFEFNQWLEDNLSYLDTVKLFHVADIYPNLTDQIEIYIKNQIKGLIFMFSSQNIDEILQLLELWENKIGTNDNFLDLLHELKSTGSRSHKVKSLLIKYKIK
jgi:hypothetical protein